MNITSKSLRVLAHATLGMIAALTMGASSCSKKPVAVPEAGFVFVKMVSRATADTAETEYAQASGAARVRYVIEGGTGDEARAAEQTLSFRGGINLPVKVKVKKLKFDLARLEVDDSTGTQVLRLAGRRLQNLIEGTREGANLRIVLTRDGSADPEWDLVEPFPDQPAPAAN